MNRNISPHHVAIAKGGGAKGRAPLLSLLCPPPADVDRVGLISTTDDKTKK